MIGSTFPTNEDASASILNRFFFPHSHHPFYSFFIAPTFLLIHPRQPLRFSESTTHRCYEEIRSWTALRWIWYLLYTTDIHHRPEKYSWWIEAALLHLSREFSRPWNTVTRSFGRSLRRAACDWILSTTWRRFQVDRGIASPSDEIQASDKQSGELKTVSNSTLREKALFWSDRELAFILQTNRWQGD